MTEGEAAAKECRVGGPLAVFNAPDGKITAQWPRCSASQCNHWRFAFRSTTDGHCGLGGKPD